MPFGLLVSSPEPLGSQGEVIVYPSSRRPSVVRPFVRPPFSKIFSSETAWPIKVEPPWEGGTKVYINGPGHITKMAATPIYGKNPSKTFSRTGGPIFTKLGMYHRGLLPILVSINDDPGVTLTYFMARSNLENLGFSIGKGENSGFSETIAACDLKVGRYRQLIDFMKVCEY